MKKKILAISSSVLLLFGQTAGLVSAQEIPDNFPLAEETMELDFFVGKGPQSNIATWNDHPFWQLYEEMTNVHINWEEVANEAIEEQRNLVLVSGDLPDAFYSANFPSTDLFRYGKQGVFIPLNDLLEENAPNFYSIMEEFPEVRNAITFPDGNIYSLPYVFENDFVSLRAGAMPWISKEALETVGMDVPETTEEFYEFLVAVKEQMPDKVPMGAPNMGMIMSYLLGSYGLATNGGGNGAIQLNDENQVEFYATSDRYREVLEFLNRLYSEGLIDNSIYSNDWNTYVANQGEDLYASYIFWGPGIDESEEFSEKYDSISALEGPHGDQLYVDYSAMVNSPASFIITSANENPELTLQWIDYFFSEEGSSLMYRGIEGDTFEYVDGVAQFTDKVIEDGIVHHLTWLGNNQGILLSTTFIGGESSPATVAAADKLSPYVVEPWSAFTHTEEEIQFLTAAGQDIERYTNEMRENFISGQASFEQWDDYVQTLESMDLDRYVEIKQAAFDRNQELQ